MQKEPKSKIKTEHMIQFGEFRKISLKLWKKKSLRTRGFNKFNDNISKSLECKWQRKYVTKIQKHNSFYCSIGEWNNHITDLLSDKTYDKLNLEKSDNRKCLFRHYTRIMLVTSEILTDFQDFYKYLLPEVKNISNKFNNDNSPFTFEKLLGYINTYCKHKLRNVPEQKNYHIINHHIEYLYADIFEEDQEYYLTHFETEEEKPIKWLFVPRLNDIIKQIMYCYTIVDQELVMNFNIHAKKLQRLEINLEL